jgi:hypothetical protein
LVHEEGVEAAMPKVAENLGDPLVLKILSIPSLPSEKPPTSSSSFLSGQGAPSNLSLSPSYRVEWFIVM